MRSCAVVIGVVTLLVAGLVAAVFYSDDVRHLAARVVPGLEPPASAAVGGPELAERVEAKVVALGQGDAEEMKLSAEEVNAWITHGLRGYFPSFLADVTAALAEDDLTLAGRVIVRQVPGIERLGPMVAFLGDTADVSASGRLDGLEPGRGVFYIDVVRLGAVPLPDQLRDQLLAAIRGSTEGANAVSFELPPFVGDLAVREGELVMRRVDGDR